MVLFHSQNKYYCSTVTLFAIIYIIIVFSELQQRTMKDLCQKIMLMGIHIMVLNTISPIHVKTTTFMLYTLLYIIITSFRLFIAHPG